MDRFGIPYLLIQNNAELQKLTDGGRPSSFFVDREGRLLRLNDEKVYEKATHLTAAGMADLYYTLDKADIEKVK